MEIWGNGPENCLAAAYVFVCVQHEIKENGRFERSAAKQLLSNCLAKQLSCLYKKCLCGPLAIDYSLWLL